MVYFCMTLTAGELILNLLIQDASLLLTATECFKISGNGTFLYKKTKYKKQLKVPHNEKKCH